MALFMRIPFPLKVLPITPLLFDLWFVSRFRFIFGMILWWVGPPWIAVKLWLWKLLLYKNVVCCLCRLSGWSREYDNRLSVAAAEKKQNYIYLIFICQNIIFLGGRIKIYRQILPWECWNLGWNVLSSKLCDLLPFCTKCAWGNGKVLDDTSCCSVGSWWFAVIVEVVEDALGEGWFG